MIIASSGFRLSHLGLDGAFRLREGYDHCTLRFPHVGGQSEFAKDDFRGTGRFSWSGEAFLQSFAARSQAESGVSGRVHRLESVYGKYAGQTGQAVWVGEALLEEVWPDGSIAALLHMTECALRSSGPNGRSRCIPLIIAARLCSSTGFENR